MATCATRDLRLQITLWMMSYTLYLCMTYADALFPVDAYAQIQHSTRVTAPYSRALIPPNIIYTTHVVWILPRPCQSDVKPVHPQRLSDANVAW